MVVNRHGLTNHCYTLRVQCVKRSMAAGEQVLIPDGDKALCRLSILEVMVMAPDSSRRLLRQVLRRMLEDEDFPMNAEGVMMWPGVSEQLLASIGQSDERTLSGGLLSLYQIACHFRFKSTSSVPFFRCQF